MRPPPASAPLQHTPSPGTSVVPCRSTVTSALPSRAAEVRRSSTSCSCWALSRLGPQPCGAPTSSIISPTACTCSTPPQHVRPAKYQQDVCCAHLDARKVLTGSTVILHATRHGAGQHSALRTRVSLVSALLCCGLTSVSITSTAWSSDASNSCCGLSLGPLPAAAPVSPAGGSTPCTTPVGEAGEASPPPLPPAPLLARHMLLLALLLLALSPRAAAGGLPSSSAVAGCSSDKALMLSTQPAASVAAELGCCWWCRPLWCGRPDMVPDGWHTATAEGAAVPCVYLLVCYCTCWQAVTLVVCLFVDLALFLAAAVTGGTPSAAGKTRRHRCRQDSTQTRVLKACAIGKHQVDCCPYCASEPCMAHTCTRPRASSHACH